MRTSLNKIKTTEDYLSGRMPVTDRLLFQARMIVDPVLRRNIWGQRTAYALIRLYGRKNLKKEIRAVHSKILQDPAHAPLREQIRQIFINP